MKMTRIAYAIVMGALSVLASRLGVTVTIFCFVYFSRFSIASEAQVLGQWEKLALYWLPALSVAVGIFVHMMRKFLQGKSQAADKIALPFVDQLTLRFLNRGNLYRTVLRGQSVHSLRLAQHLLVVFISSAAVFLIVPELGILAALLLLVSVVMALAYRHSKVLPHEVNQLSTSVGERTDHILMSLMVLGCITILPRDLWLHAAVGLFVLARFLASYRMLVTSVLHIRAARNTPPLPPIVKRPAPPKPVALPVKKPPPKPVLPGAAKPAAAPARPPQQAPKPQPNPATPAPAAPPSAAAPASSD